MNQSCQQPCCRSDDLARVIIEEVADAAGDINRVPVGQVVVDFAYTRVHLKITDSRRARRDVERKLAKRPLPH